MIQNPDYVLKAIDGEDYLIPSGTSLAERMPILHMEGGLRLIWDMLSEDLEEMELVRRTVNYYEAYSHDDECIVRTDTRYMWFLLKKNRAIIEKSELDLKKEKGIVFESEEMDVYREENGYRVKLHCEGIEEVVHISENPESEIYDLQNLSKASHEELITKRTGFARKVLFEGKIFLHSVSLLYKEKLWLFSAASGVGKSTHVDLWIKNGVGEIINGDLNLLGINENGQVTAYGTPWRGTSDEFSLENYPVGGIIIIQRDYEPSVEELSGANRIFSVLKRSISPRWNAEYLEINYKIAKEISEKTMVVKLHATMEQNTFETIKEYIDAHLS